MRRYHILLLQLLMVLFFKSVKSHFYLQNLNTFSHRSRVKRDWNYPPMSIVESNGLISSSFVRKRINAISSDNDDVYKYALVPGTDGVDQGYFTIVNTETAGKKVGELWQEKKIDREVHSQFRIYAEALNAQGNKAEPEDIELTINVIDVNDQKPVFLPSTLVGEVYENSPIGSSFLTLRATDDDAYDLSNLYGVVRYAMVPDSEHPAPSDGQSARFSVNGEDGRVFLLSPINREEVHQITFLALAMDGPEGGGGFTTTGTVIVNILDYNDNAPVFTMNPYPKASIGELAPVGKEVTSVEATDEDDGINKAVYFDIISGDSDGQFQIISEPNQNGASLGKIVVQSPLDFETTTSYQLTILAKNKDAKDNANTLTSTTVITIEVTDENEPPVFIGAPYSATVPENEPDRRENIVQVIAEDYDFNGVQLISYGFVNTEPWFDISSDGIISTVANKPIDREHVTINQDTNEYFLLVTATDDYNPIRATGTTTVIITITDKNDNAPEEDGTGWNTVLCETPSEEMKRNITLISVKDSDSSMFTPFHFEILDTDSKFNLEYESGNSRHVQTTESHFDRNDVAVYEIPIQVTDTAAGDQSAQTSTLTLTINVCSCNANYIPNCSAAYVAGFPLSAIIAIIAAILILLIIILAVVAYRRRSKSDLEKAALFYDEDDVRENLQAYYEEGGEEDNDGYDISALQAPPLIDPKRQDITPLTSAQPQTRSRMPPDTDVGDYINDAKDKADGDPTAPPYDSILVFDYEGQGSDAGSLSSLNSGTTDASQDYDYLNDWGPRFKKLADMYGGGEDD